MAAQSSVQGVNELIAKLTALGAGGVRVAKASVSAVADLTVADAKRNAPADLGTIRQNIGQVTTVDRNKVTARVFSSAPESPFMEFGTGGSVIIPAEMAEIASQFKGASGGDFKAFVLALTAWVKRKGINPAGAYQISTHSKITRGNKKDIDEATAYAIARSILLKGVKPHPFLYPAYVANAGKLLPMLQAGFRSYMRSPQSYF